MVHGCDQHLQRTFFDLGRRNVFDDHVEKRTEIPSLLIQLAHRPSVPPGGVDTAKVELIIVRVELAEQIKDLVKHLVGAGQRPVNLVDHHHRLQVELERLLKHEPGLRHRPLECVDKEQHTVRHLEYPLHLTAEVGMPRRVDQVDADPLVCNSEIL